MAGTGERPPARHPVSAFDRRRLPGREPAAGHGPVGIAVDLLRPLLREHRPEGLDTALVGNRPPHRGLDSGDLLEDLEPGHRVALPAAQRHGLEDAPQPGGAQRIEYLRRHAPVLLLPRPMLADDRLDLMGPFQQCIFGCIHRCIFLK